MRGILLAICLCTFCISCTHAAAQRIVTLAPNMTELVFAIGAGKKIVGVSAYSDYPAAAQRIPVVASANGVDMERLLSLHPDLVIAWSEGTSAGALDKLKALGIPTYVMQIDRIGDIAKAAEAVGPLVGTPKTAHRFATQFRTRFAAIKERYAKRPKKTVFYQVSQNPLMTVGKHTVVSEAITVCGGRNIFDDALGFAPRIGLSEVLYRSPDVIFVSDVSGQNRTWMQAWQAYPQLKAVQHHAIFPVQSDVLERYGPRMLTGVEQMCVAIDVANT